MEDQNAGHEQARPESTTQKPEETVAYWQAQAATWKSKYDGQQGYITTLRNERDKFKADWEGVNIQVETLNSEKAALEGTLNTKVTEFTTVAEKSAKAERELEIMQYLIQPEYSGLVDFYKDGQLPVDGKTGDGLKEALDKFNAKLVAKTGETAQLRSSGSTPSTPPPQSPGAGTSVKDAQDKMTNALVQHGFGTPQYEEARREYMALITTPGVQFKS